MKYPNCGELMDAEKLKTARVDLKWMVLTFTTNTEH